MPSSRKAMRPAEGMVAHLQEGYRVKGRIASQMTRKREVCLRNVHWFTLHPFWMSY